MTLLVLGLLGWCLAGVAATLFLAGVLRVRDLRDPRGSASAHRRAAGRGGRGGVVVDLTAAPPSPIAPSGRGPLTGDDPVTGPGAVPVGDDDAPSGDQPPAGLPRTG